MLDNILLELQKRYDCSNPIYLSDFYQAGGDQRLYTQLKALHQLVYKDSYRILVIQDCADIHNYKDLPGKAITALQKHASQLDISNFFILLLSSDHNIQSELELARTLYSTDDCAIEAHIVNDLPAVNLSTTVQDTFCVLPWVHLYVGTDGNVLPCCVADHQHPLGNIEEQSIDSISKSPAFTQLRKNMIAGVRSKECDRCYQQEDAGLDSPRLLHNVRWSNEKINNLKTNSIVDTFEPVYFDIRLNNICNLKCRTCSGYFSSAIAQEETELFGNVTSVSSSLRLQQRKTGLKEILKYLPSAEKIYFAGGEPLLTAEHYEILNALIESGNTNLEIAYNTNFTTLKFQNISVLDLWRKFSNITIGASLDATGEVAEYVRHGSNWKTIESNLNLVKVQCPHVNFTVASTVGLLNVASLIDLQKTWHTNKILDLSKFSMSIMIGPNHLTVCALPLEHKYRIDKLIKDHIAWCQDFGVPRLVSQWNNVLHYMWSKDDSHYMAKFRRLTNLMDTHRKESLAQVLPELQDLL